VKDYIVSAPENKDVAAFSDLVAATSSAIETLNKILMSDRRNETLVQVKQMDIDSKRELKQEDTSQKLLATREEVFKMLMNNVKSVEKEAIEIEPDLPNS
jgi:hypothetical protein